MAAMSAEDRKQQIEDIGALVARLREEGAISVKIDVTRGGTMRCEGVFQEQTNRHQFKTGRK